MCALVTGVQTCALPIFSAAANRFGGSCMSTVLVTGAFGNVGRSVVRHLLEAGHHVVAADLETPRAAAMAAGLGFNVKPCWGNICDSSFWPTALAGVDVVIHLAAILPPTANRVPELAPAVKVPATPTSDWPRVRTEVLI